jgi:hypothetical protein
VAVPPCAKQKPEGSKIAPSRRFAYEKGLSQSLRGGVAPSRGDGGYHCLSSASGGPMTAKGRALARNYIFGNPAILDYVLETSDYRVRVLRRSGTPELYIQPSGNLKANHTGVEAKK